MDTGDRCGHWGLMGTLGTDGDTGDRYRHWGLIQTLGTGTDTDDGDSISRENHEQISNMQNHLIPTYVCTYVGTHIRTLPSPAIIPTFSVLWSEQVEEGQ